MITTAIFRSELKLFQIKTHFLLKNATDARSRVVRRSSDVTNGKGQTLGTKNAVIFDPKAELRGNRSVREFEEKTTSTRIYSRVGIHFLDEDEYLRELVSDWLRQAQRDGFPKRKTRAGSSLIGEACCNEELHVWPTDPRKDRLR